MVGSAPGMARSAREKLARRQLTLQTALSISPSMLRVAVARWGKFLDWAKIWRRCWVWKNRWGRCWVCKR
ncbi:hypothetical protein E2542_SST22421 [Spatholobus suberectus]|nr:hypothetical protein E2542_SST22421 [Spatholobus suberectus]